MKVIIYQHFRLLALNLYLTFHQFIIKTLYNIS